MAVKQNSTEDRDDSNLPPSQLDPEDLYARLRGWYIEDMKGNSAWYKEAMEDYGFESGDQWREEDKAKGRLSVTFNRVKPTVDVICGMEVTNRQEVQFIPRTTSPAFPKIDPATGQEVPPNPTDDDSEVTEGYTEVARWARDNCDAEDEESDSFRDTTICGLGWTETSMDYETEPEGRIVIDRIDPLEMGWDCTATKRNLDDSKRFHRTRREISIADAKAMFPGEDEADLHAGFALESQLGEGIDHDREKARAYGNKNMQEQRTRVTMVIIEWCEVETSYQVFNPADQSTFIATTEEFTKLKERTKELGVEDIISAPMKRRKWYRATLGGKVLEMKPAPCENSSTFKCITGYRDRNKKQWYGIVRPMRDPQRWANKFFSVALEQIAASGKGIMAEQGAFVDDKKAEQEWSKTGNISWLKTGAIAGQKVMLKPQPPMLTGLADLMALSLQAIRDVTGVNQETIGMADRNQAASLEYQRRQAGVTILAALFDNLRRYRKEQGRVLLYFIRTYISDGRMVRILGEQGTAKVIQLMQQPDTLQFDVIVDQSPSSPNQKEAAWLVTEKMLPLAMQAGASPSVLMEFLKMSPMPESGIQRLRRAHERDQRQQAEQGPSIEEQKVQAEIGKIQADGQKSQVEGQLKAQELQLRKYEADLNAATTIQTLQADGEQRQHEAAMRQHDMQMKQMDMQQKQMEIDGTLNEIAMPHIGQHMPPMIESFTKGLEAMASAMVQSNQALAASISQQSQALNDGLTMLARSMSMPKVAKLAPDGMTATVEPVRMQ